LILPPAGTVPVVQVCEEAPATANSSLAPVIVASTAPTFLRVMKTTLQLVALGQRAYALVTSSIGALVAELVVENRNQATIPAATTALMVISTVTIGGIPPNLFSAIAIKRE